MTTIVGQATSSARRAVLAALCGAALIVSMLLIERTVFDRYGYAATQRILDARATTDQITLVHQRMMLAANMAAATADQSWIDSYGADLPIAEEALRSATKMAKPDIAERFEAETRLSHTKLVEFNQQIFDAVAKGNATRAREILSDPLYQYHQQMVIDGTARFISALIASVRSDLSRLEYLELAVIAVGTSLSILGALVLWWRVNANLNKSRDEHVRAETAITRLAMNDVLTGLSNRLSFRRGLVDAIARAETRNSKVAVLMIDLDRFKPVNDRHGHLIGDLVLKEVAARLCKIGRAGELRGRFGGDEFVAIIEYDADDTIPRGAGERLVRSLSEPMLVQGVTVEIGCSVGIALYPTDATDDEELIRKADVALYRAKNEGRATVRCYLADMDSEAQVRAELEAEIGQAIKSRAIVPYFQPVIDLSSGTIKGFEVLARWHHASKGIIMPDAFIKLAGRAGLDNDLTLSLLQKACLELRALPAGLTLSINVASRQLEDERLAHKVLATLSKTKFPPNRLQIELTELALVNDMAAARAAIVTFKSLGIKVALDDFGIGYSSLSHLADLPFDMIKVDRSIVGTMHDRSESIRTVIAIAGLGKSLGMVTVAEGVETAREEQAVRAAGCVAAQGYLYSKPLPAADLQAVMARFTKTAHPAASVA